MFIHFSGRRPDHEVLSRFNANFETFSERFANIFEHTDELLDLVKAHEITNFYIGFIK